MVLTGYSPERAIDRTFRVRAVVPGRVVRKGLSVLQQLKSQGFRIVFILSMLASSALVLQAGQRWVGH
jgi:hypothetical protein